MEKTQISNVFCFVLPPENFVCVGDGAWLSLSQVHPPTCPKRFLMPCQVAKTHQMLCRVTAVGTASKRKLKVAKLSTAPGMQHPQGQALQQS